jgi:glycerophosphoryl diester phosphodiesterase
LSGKSFIEIHGHRGARGLFPENTITSFIEAVKMGIDFLEMDLVVSKDHKIVVSHEAWMNPDFCLTPDGKEIEKDAGKDHNLYKMNFSEIARCDCGKKTNKEFPSQKSVSEHKPLLSEVVEKVEAFVKINQFPSIKYNLEIKSEIDGDGIFNPEPGEFVRLVYDEIKKLNIQSQIILQSFDARILRELKKIDTSIPISLLVENAEGLNANLDHLGFTPDIYAPEFYLIDEHLVKMLREKNIKLITWTVNEIADMKKMIDLGVEGIITDYPNRLKSLITK